MYLLNVKNNFMPKEIVDVKTGEALDKDDEGNTFLCESFENPETHVVYTTRTLIVESE